MAKDPYIRYSRRDGCWWIDIPDGMISADTKADAQEFLRLYNEVGIKEAMRRLEEAEAEMEEGA